MDKFDRIYALHRIFSSRRHPVPMSVLCDELECRGVSTVKRIIRQMREELGAPIFNVRGQGWRYDPTKAFELPGMWFTSDELAALLSIQQLLATMQPGLLEEALSPIRRRIDALLAKSCPDVALDGRRLSIRYHARNNGKASEREVSPQRLIHYRDNWYLDAFCHQRNELRSFALERITEARPTGKSGRRFSEDKLDAHYAGAYGIFAGAADKTAVLRFSPHAARWVADESWHPKQRSEWLDDGYYELRIPYGNATELIMDICRYGPDVEVIAPSELRSQVAGRLRDSAEQYV